MQYVTKRQAVKNCIRAGKVNTSEVQPTWCHAWNSNTYVPEHRLHQNRRGVSLSKKDIIWYSTYTQQKLSLFIIGCGICVKYFQQRRVHGDIDLTKIKDSKQWEAVIFDLGLISENNCSLFCVAGNCTVHPSYKNIFSLVHHLVSNRGVMSAIGKCCFHWCLLNSFCTITYNYIKFFWLNKLALK